MQVHCMNNSLNMRVYYYVANNWIWGWNNCIYLWFPELYLYFLSSICISFHCLTEINTTRCHHVSQPPEKPSWGKERLWEDRQQHNQWHNQQHNQRHGESGGGKQAVSLHLCASNYCTYAELMEYSSCFGWNQKTPVYYGFFITKNSIQASSTWGSTRPSGK